MSLVAALALGTVGVGSQDRQVTAIEITRSALKGPSALLQIEMSPLPVSRLSPQKFGTPPRQWEFPWLVRGMTRLEGLNQYNLRFRVYSQERRASGDKAAAVARMLTALWEENYVRLRRDHMDRYNGKIIDVFLCWGGKAGGEQRFEVAEEGGQSKHVNSIYFYDINSFDEPIETAREVAHEYGHAVLPAVGIYEAPEDWANGYLGEKLFMRWLRDSMAAGHAFPADAMNVPKAELDTWVTKNVDPLVLKASASLPTPELLAPRSAEGADRYIGLALYADSLLPSSVFSRSLLLAGSTDAKDYPEGIALAAEEPAELELNVPPTLRGRALWIPLNKGRLVGGKILRIVGKWAKVQPIAEQMTVVNRRA